MMKTDRYVFLNCNAARKGRIDGKCLPEGYVLTAKFFGCGVIDRTQVLDTGFKYVVIDPLPSDDDHGSFDAIADTVAAGLIDEAIRTGRTLQVLWSGGIDSTVALVALLQRLSEMKRLDVIEVAYSIDSINEYPEFFHGWIKGQLRTVRITKPISRHLDPSKLIVTGELGDQLFGSDKLRDLVADGRAFQSYQDVMPEILAEKLGDPGKAETALRYLEPQMAVARRPIVTVYDMLWWMNFTLKWQQVSLRIPVFRGTGVRELWDATRHFFRDRRFQNWSLQLPTDAKIRDTWTSYKYPAKDFIFRFTGDDGYRTSKVKDQSLRSVLVDRRGRGNYRYRIYMSESFEPRFKVFEKGRKTQWKGI